MRSLEFQDLRLARGKLEKLFYQGFDPSWVRTCWREIDAGKPHDSVGMGTWFKAYRLSARIGSLDYALLVAKPEFLDRGASRLDSWLTALHRFKDLDSPLVPPLEVLREQDGTLAYLAPYCADVWTPSACQAQDFERLCRDLEDQLQVCSLTLDDVWQFRSWQGWPLLTDYSDLRFRLAKPA